MATLLVEKIKPGDFVRNEITGYSRDALTVLSGQTLKCGQVCARNVAGKMLAITGGVSEVHTLAPNAAATGGTYTIKLWHKDGYWVETAAIAYNAATATIAAAINAVLGTSAVACGGTIFSAGTGGLTITYSGTGYTLITQPLPQVMLGSLLTTASITATRSTPAGGANEVHTVTLSAAMTAGTWGMTFYTPDNVPLAVKVPFNTSVAQTITDINTAITAAATAWYGAASAGAVLASGDSNAGVIYTLTYSGVGFTGKAIPRLPVVLTQATTGPTSAIVARTNAAPYGICLAEADASAADLAGVPFLVRMAQVDLDRLYFGGANPALVAEQLALVGIIARPESATRLIG